MDNRPIPTYKFSPKYLSDIPFQILQFEKLPPIATEPFPRRRTFYEIFWIREGSGFHHIDFEAWTISKNTLHFITPGQVNLWEIQQQVSGYAILFTPEFVATNMFEKITLQSFDFFRYTAEQPLAYISEDYVANFNMICEQMLWEYNRDNFARFTLLQCQLTAFLIHAQRHYIEIKGSLPRSITDHLLAEYRQLIDEHFQDIKSIKDYAHMLNITSGHLRDITRDKLGVTPSDLLNKRIVLEAKRLLTHSEKTIAEIGLQLKFDDPSYFSRFFKREAGTTPTAFRQQIHEKYQHPHD